MPKSDVRQFAQDLTALQRPLFVYITKLLGRPNDAEDVLQEVNRVLWEKMNEFEPGTSLGAWASKIAYFEVLTFRKKKARQRLTFSDETLALIAADAEDCASSESDEHFALHKCLGKLIDRDRELITKRYVGENNLRKLADLFQRSEPSLCRSLTRIRMTLLECIRNSISAGGAT